MTSTPVYDRMCEAIKACQDWRPDAGVNDPAEALAVCLRVARNLEPEQQAAEVRLRAERGYCRTLKALAGR